MTARPVSEPIIPAKELPLKEGENDLDLAAECVYNSWVSSAGRCLDEFEQRWAKYCGMKHEVAVSGGTAKPA